MYICEKCHQPSYHGQEMARVVVEKRERTYTRTFKDRETGEVKVIETHGWETVREEKRHPKCV